MRQWRSQGERTLPLEKRSPAKKTILLSKIKKTVKGGSLFVSVKFWASSGVARWANSPLKRESSARGHGRVGRLAAAYCLAFYSYDLLSV